MNVSGGTEWVYPLIEGVSKWGRGLSDPAQSKMNVNQPYLPTPENWTPYSDLGFYKTEIQEVPEHMRKGTGVVSPTETYPEGWVPLEERVAAIMEGQIYEPAPGPDPDYVFTQSDISPESAYGARMQGLADQDYNPYARVEGSLQGAMSQQLQDIYEQSPELRWMKEKSTAAIVDPETGETFSGYKYSYNEQGEAIGFDYVPAMGEIMGARLYAEQGKDDVVDRIGDNPWAMEFGLNFFEQFTEGAVAFQDGLLVIEEGYELDWDAIGEDNIWLSEKLGWLVEEFEIPYPAWGGSGGWGFPGWGSGGQASITPRSSRRRSGLRLTNWRI